MSSASTGGTEGSSPASSPASAASIAMAAPKFGTLVPNRIFVGGISASTSEAELAQLFSAYGNVKATKIISDRAGVSKGYGFVTFETDAEARRLQQESECIILRERKLNIAPAIKKQPFNRSFDGGSGSPPAVPTSTYYYTNGMGLTYQNGLTFYNAGAPAPGTPIAPPTDPATIYQAAGVFGPQATSGHQTFAPVMYSCPAPSLYMPQQYQYPPMTYESYYTGAAGGGGPPQYALYATSGTGGAQQQQQSQQSQSNGSVAGSGGGSGVVGGGGNGTGAASPPALTSMPPPPTHYYAPSAPPPPPPHHHHHPPVAAGPPPPQPQLDHLYYSFSAPGPPPVPPQQQHQTIGIGDQQLLLYTTDPTSCQQINATSDSQASAQEDTRSTSSHSDHPQQHSDTQQQQQSQSQLSTTPLMSLMPLKYPIMSARYANYHPLAMHPGSIQQSHHTLNQHASQSLTNGASGQNFLSSERTEDAASPSPMQRTQAASAAAAAAAAYLYPATVYIPHGTGYPTSTGPTVGASLLPTPGTAYDASLKIHQAASCSAKPGSLGQAIGNSALGINLGYHRTHNNYSILAGIQHQQTYTKNQGFPRKYGGYQGSLNSSDRGRYYGNKTGPALSQQYEYAGPTTGIFGHKLPPKPYHFGANSATPSSYNGQSYGNPRRNSSDQWSDSHEASSRYGNSRRRDSSIHSRSGKNSNRDEAQQQQLTDGKSSASATPVSDSRLTEDTSTKTNVITSSAISVTDRNTKSPGVISNNNNNSPPPAPYSPMTRPIPNISPPVSQVQFYATGAQTQSRYHQQQMSHHQQQQQQQQQQSGQRRYGGIGQSMNSGRKLPGSGSQVGGQGSGETLRRPKSKVNGLMQSGIVVGKHQDDNCLGGGGDATGSNIASRMPITPPSTPRNNTNSSAIGNNDSNPMSDACHQMQALSL